jgi:hypothetical protein
MKILLSLIISILCLTLAFAQDRQAEEQDAAQRIGIQQTTTIDYKPYVIDPVPTQKPLETSLGLEISYITYEEPDVNVEENGVMVGILGEYNYRPEGETILGIIDVLHLDARGAFGQMDYEGSGTIDDINNYLFEGRAWVGKDFDFLSGGRLTPYVGIGYRMLYDDGGGLISSTGAGAYDRRSQYVYLPIGFELRSAETINRWKFGLDAEYDHFLHGWQYSDISGFLTSGGAIILGDSYNEQDKGYGLRGAIHIIKKGEGMDIDLAPYIRYWNIEDSDVDVVSTSAGSAGFYEPHNESTEIGVRISILF